MGRLVDADALKCSYSWWEEKGQGILQKLVDGVVDGAPTVDAVPVTRCGDCKYMDDSVHTFGWNGVCRYWGKSTDYSWFCAAAERKNGEA